MRKFLFSAAALAAVAAGAGLWFTRPLHVDPAALAALAPGDINHGEEVFYAAGCANCHRAPGANAADDPPVLAGGQRFPSDFGTFIAPNISQDAQAGIGGWDLQMLADAMVMGTGPGNRHLYPAFPYGSYHRAALQDVADLFAYLQSLPADPTPSSPHELDFPFSIRQGLGLWKALYLKDDWVLAEAPTPEITRGRYLVEGLGHCAECHTPRDAMGGLDRDQWLAGVPGADGGPGGVPNITPGALTWSEDEIVEYLTSGFTPDYDSAGGHMAHVVESFARLPESDRLAVAQYLKALPARP